MTGFRMVIEGVPVPKGRPRFGRGHVYTYLPKNEERRSAGGYHRALVDTTHFRAETSNRRRWRYVN